jgi:hypothetical protein
MAGMEVVVRPVVFPDIRPTPARLLPPQDDPKQGICEIKGTGSFVVSFSTSSSYSASYGTQKETKRRVDTARVYQEQDDGTINKENFVDIQVPNKIWKQGGRAPTSNVPVMSDAEKAQRERDARMYESWVEYYKKVEEKKNIEIKKRNEIIANKDPPDK